MDFSHPAPFFSVRESYDTRLNFIGYVLNFTYVDAKLIWIGSTTLFFIMQEMLKKQEKLSDDKDIIVY